MGEDPRELGEVGKEWDSVSLGFFPSVVIVWACESVRFPDEPF